MRRIIKNPLAELSLSLRSSMEKYTKVTFASQNNKPFITNSHHRQIFNVLLDTDVQRGR